MRISTSAAVPPGAMLRRRNSSWRGGSTARCSALEVVGRRIGSGTPPRRASLPPGRANSRCASTSKKLRAAALVERLVGGERLARERGARVFAAFGQQRLAQREQLLRGARRFAPPPNSRRRKSRVSSRALSRRCAAFASPTRRSASSPATRSMSSWYLSSTPSVLFTVSGSSATRSSATSAVRPVDRLGDAGQLEQVASCAAAARTPPPRATALGAPGALRRRISSSRSASG